ncbi:ABC transporter ATP-binding protein [Candidatus Uhrbacteria bacterium]|nr:ABC transporter ATP-binding protein [Candidatus Uhrbacteria bacterium]
MKKEVISWQAVNQVLTDYSLQYKTYPYLATMAFLLPAIGNVLVFFVPPLVVAGIIDKFVAEGVISIGEVAAQIVFFGTIWLLGEACWRIGMHALIRLLEKGQNNLCGIAFRRLMQRDYAFYANNFGGSVVKKAMAFSQRYDIFTTTLVFNITTNILPIAFAVVVLWYYSIWIALFLIFVLGGAVCVAVPIIRRRSRLVALRHDAGSRLVGRLSDAITNIPAIKSFAKEKSEYRTFGIYVNDFTQKFKQAGDYENLRLEMILSPIYVATNVCGLLLALLFTNKLALQPGAILVIFTYYAGVTRILWEINRIYRNIESSVSEAAEFTQLLSDPPAVVDTPRARKLVVAKAAIRFDSVTFSYEDASTHERVLLKDFTLDINANERVGLVGPSGGGKTTITKLLIRFIDLHSGTILIDGQDISKVTQESLRESIAYVPQEPLLFHRSLFENIAYGNERTSRSDVARAAKLAHAEEFIARLPGGYETLVGERGIKLSGGQRQRIAVARALLKNAPILVLDEATSSLDSKSEKYIQDGLWKLMKGKTVLVIAHRLSTIRHLDRIIVLDRGKIVQQGTHEELIKAKGLYVKLWSLQSGEFLRD